jgi:DNA-directed RNA polymerase subunit beta'
MGHIELAAPVAHVWYTRRVPSHLGLLLDISRRNLDRVLYFAQYVITHVDEDARQKGLKRLDDEVSRQVADVRQQAEAQIAEITTRRDEAVAKARAEIDEANLAYESDQESLTEPVMKSAQDLQRAVDEKQGTTIRKALIFEPTGATIADKGETIGREHGILLQQAVDEKLDEIKRELSEAHEVRMERLQGEIELAQAQAEQEIAEIQGRLDAEVAKAETSVEGDRKELLELAQMQFLGETRFRELKQKWGNVFRADMGAEAFYEILRSMELEKLAKELWQEIKTTRSKQRKKRAVKRLRVVESLRRSNNRPEWMILTILPVIPPDLRPMVQLDGGRFATSDLNDLYRRVINRNNRLKRLLELGAPDVIVRNEKRMLQEAVDSLIDNSQRGKALSRRGRRELKSLSDMLKGKKGRFRRNLLGKRVDYSGRSVIVVGPQLKLHQCGLPKTMALELYRPFVIAKLVEYNYASNVKGAKRIIERERPEVWEVLEEVIKERPVLLNRAPTLHRLGIQAFEPILVEGKAIQIHPLVCTAFNADFDGDQMAVHVPLSDKSVWEARQLMISTANLLKPASGEPIVGPAKDMVLGVYYLTMLEEGKRGEGRVFASMDEVELAYHLGQVDIHAKIRVVPVTKTNVDGEQPFEDAEKPPELVETSVGRVLFNMILPPNVRFKDNNRVLDRGGLQELVAQVYQQYGADVTTDVVDRIKAIGFKYSTVSGATIAVSDLTVPAKKAEILERVANEVTDIEKQYRRGLLTQEEAESRTISLWQTATKDTADAVREGLDPYSSLSIMALSGATKGGFGPIAQLAGMRGLVADPAGKIIPLPIRSNFREGLSALEYFISTHGARKGLADTALRTADAGYLTRRLVDVAQDVIINELDCGTEQGITIRAKDNVGSQTLAERIVGRYAAKAVADPQTGEVIVGAGEMISEEHGEAIQKAGIVEVSVRSPLSCTLHHGICATCYGRDLGRGKLVELGAAVGIVAAQSIGEPGTQLTLRTFHTGGVASGTDITYGLPRVEELFEARKKPKGEAIMSDIDGVVHIRKAEGGLRILKVVDSQLMRDEYEVPGNWSIKVEDGQEVKEGEIIASRGEQNQLAKHSGRIVRRDRHISLIFERREEEEYEIPVAARLMPGVEEGARVKAGDQITEGSKNPHRILRILGPEACQGYLLSEVQKVYRSQGVNINDKHFEVIIRKMLSRVQIMASGDTALLPGELIDRLELNEINEQMRAEGKRPAASLPQLLGVTKASLQTDSFLSASSFQHTIKVLAQAAIEAKEDRLLGLKENVIIGKLIPAGTGFPGMAVPELPRKPALMEPVELREMPEIGLTTAAAAP